MAPTKDTTHGRCAKALFYAFALVVVNAVPDSEIPCRHRETKKLRNGVRMPRVAFGTAGLPRGGGHEAVVTTALNAGFRSFDTAQAYEWYDEAAVARAFNASGVPRSSLFVTTKVHPRDLGYEATLKAVERSLAVFGTTYVDLVLLHYPRCFPGVCTSAEIARTEKDGGWREAWRALGTLAATGVVRARGVSNFNLDEVQSMDPPPLVVQNWFDPFRQDRALVAWCSAHQVAYTSYSTLGGQWLHQGTQINPVFTSPVLASIAQAHGGMQHLPAVVLSWALQRGILVLPRSASEEHIRANAALLSPSSALNQPQLDHSSSSSSSSNGGGSSATNDHTPSETAPRVAAFLSSEELERIDALDGAVDTHVECAPWAAAGECDNNPSYMHRSCRASCGIGSSEAEPLLCDGRSVSARSSGGGHLLANSWDLDEEL